MASLFRKSTPLPIIQPSATDNTAEVQAAARAEADRLRKRRGYRSTIATGSQGITSVAPTTKATLG